MLKSVAALSHDLVTLVGSLPYSKPKDSPWLSQLLLPPRDLVFCILPSGPGLETSQCYKSLYGTRQAPCNLHMIHAATHWGHVQIFKH